MRKMIVLLLIGMTMIGAVEARDPDGLVVHRGRDDNSGD